MMRFSNLVLGVLFIFVACDISPVAIDYNEDQCHACKMKISDSRFGSELITKKGKVYMFDAIECMVPELKRRGEDQFEFILVTDFTQPKKLIDARMANYLISPNQPSPMGAFLSAYQNKGDGESAQKDKRGELLTWCQLKEDTRLNR